MSISREIEKKGRREGISTNKVTDKNDRAYYRARKASALCSNGYRIRYRKGCKTNYTAICTDHEKFACEEPSRVPHTYNSYRDLTGSPSSDTAIPLMQPRCYRKCMQGSPTRASLPHAMSSRRWPHRQGDPCSGAVCTPRPRGTDDANEREGLLSLCGERYDRCHIPLGWPIKVKRKKRCLIKSTSIRSRARLIVHALQQTEITHVLHSRAKPYLTDDPLYTRPR